MEELEEFEEMEELEELEGVEKIEGNASGMTQSVREVEFYLLRPFKNIISILHNMSARRIKNLKVEKFY